MQYFLGFLVMLAIDLFIFTIGFFTWDAVYEHEAFWKRPSTK